MPALRATLAIGIAATALAGCGSSDSSARDPAPAPTAQRAAEATGSAKGAWVKVVQSDYGKILSDGRGRALYLFTADHGKASKCYGDCATAWPPYIVKRKPLAGSGVKGALIGTTKRSDGRLQATYAGHPVYFYEGDDEPGEVLCQAVYEFGGYWYVLRSNGRAVR